MKATVMIRRLKKDVLSELPMKRRQQVKFMHDHSTYHALLCLRSEGSAYQTYQNSLHFAYGPRKGALVLVLKISIHISFGDSKSNLNSAVGMVMHTFS